MKKHKLKLLTTHEPDIRHVIESILNTYRFQRNAKHGFNIIVLRHPRKNISQIFVVPSAHSTASYVDNCYFHFQTFRWSPLSRNPYYGALSLIDGI